jgi:hypothetical protein
MLVFCIDAVRQDVPTTAKLREVKETPEEATMKSSNRMFIVIAALLLTLAVAAARADTLNLPVIKPVTFSDQVDMRYVIENATLGKFTATGRVVSTDGVALSPAPVVGSFSLTAYFDRATGLIVKDDLANTFDPTLNVKNAGGTSLYLSHTINRFAYDLGVTLPTFDFEFFNEGGSLAGLSNAKYIGATLRNANSFTGTKSFISAASIGTVVFDNNKNGLGLETGTANVFMTPTPTAVGGGAMLLCCLFIGEKIRRRSSSTLD